MTTPRVELQPELWVRDVAAATAFYERALDARVVHRVGPPDDPDGVVQLAIGASRLWLAASSRPLRRFDAAVLGGGTGRTLLVTGDPDATMRDAVAAGATLTSPVADEHGWRLGRMVDPFGHEWEIGRPPDA
jgi:PhnB protein